MGNDSRNTRLTSSQIIFIPALIASALYIILAYAIVPLIRAYRNKYNQYSPMGVDFPTQTTSVRDRIATFILKFVLSRRREVVAASESRRGSVNEEVFADEDGDRMFGFDVDRRARGANTHV